LKKVTVLGSTGSVGEQTLDVLSQFPEQLEVQCLVAGTDHARLAQQARYFSPAAVAIYDESKADALSTMIDDADIEVLGGEDGVCEVARTEVDISVSAISGFAGLTPTLAACEGTDVLALANKESVVCAGELLLERVNENTVKMIPVDSEHNAIYQCLVGEQHQEIDKLVLTASGGPFWDMSIEDMESVTPSDALDHPNWDMGSKISIDSATMMNKGLELIEARWLFNLPIADIDISVHPQSTVHSMVKFKDGTIKAHMGAADMRYAIQYALSHPNRWQDPGFSNFELSGNELTFHEPDYERFPCLKYAQEAGKLGGLYPTAVVSADEVAVNYFLAGRLEYLQIAEVIHQVLSRLPSEFADINKPGIEEILKADEWTREHAKDYIRRL